MPYPANRRPGTVSFVRYKLGLSQQQLADSLGVSRSMIAMMETGKRKLSRPVAATYFALCEKAAAINPDGYTLVKRGRKPTRTKFSVVTNYESNRGKEKAELFREFLEQQKQILHYQHTGLQFRKKNMEERHRKLSDQLIGVEAIIKMSEGLMNTLPAGKLRDKYELKRVVFYAKEVRLKQAMRKCGVVERLKVEYQMNKLEGTIEVVEKGIAQLQESTSMKQAA